MCRRKFLFVQLAIFASLTLVSCNHNMEQLAEEAQSGVVLIRTAECYELKMSNGNSLYFAGSDFNKETGEFKGLSTSLDSLVPDIMYGTGFFISKDGKIATNRHVVEGNIKEKEVRAGLKKIIHSLEDALNETKEQYAGYLDYLNLDISSTIEDSKIKPDTTGMLEAQTEVRGLVIKRLNEIKQMLRLLSLNDPDEIELKYYNDVRIAYNNTFVQTVGELKPCTIREKSDKDDLAIIQLNTKQTPEGRHVFELTSHDMLQHYSFGEFLMHILGNDKNKTLMIIGFNKGFDLALTEEGVNAQHPMGTISRYLAGEREVQYSIHALEGTSGSPVLNRRGQVVAVNFATVDTVGNSLNLGVKEKYLYELNKNHK